MIARKIGEYTKNLQLKREAEYRAFFVGSCERHAPSQQQGI